MSGLKVRVETLKEVKNIPIPKIAQNSDFLNDSLRKSLILAILGIFSTSFSVSPLTFKPDLARGCTTPHFEEEIKARLLSQKSF